MLQVKPVPPTPSVTRPRAHFSSKGRASGLAVHVSSVAAQLGNTITGWLLSELTPKSAQQNSNPSSIYSLKKSDGSPFAEYGEAKAVFYTPKVDSGPPSPGYLGIPLGRKRAASPDMEPTITEEEEDEADVMVGVEMPRLPPPARTSPPPVHALPGPKKSPTQFRESLPIAPKQLLPPISSTPMKKSASQRKPTPIQIIPPKPTDQVDHLAALPNPLSNFPIAYSSALDSPPAIEFTAPPTPIVPSASRFDNKETPRQYPRRPKLQRTYSSSETKQGFTFDFPPTVPEKDLPKQRLQRKPRDTRRSGSECLMGFIEEYVEMRKSSVKNMKREMKFPVAGQLMCMTDAGSVYGCPRKM
jgi:hypothetical protein